MSVDDEKREDIILEGATGIYRRIDLSRASGDTSTLIPFDSDLTTIGFSLVGDMMCTALEGFMRCYVNEEERTRALLLLGMQSGRLNVFCLIFEANFPDGVSLTTTTSRAMKDMPEKGVHRRAYAWTNVYDLYQKHLQHVGELKAGHGAAEPIEATLRSLAESIDTATVRSGR